MSSSNRSFLPLTTPEAFQTLVVESATHPVVIFKHSPTCGTSAQAYDELESLLGESPVDVHIVDVLRSRPLSQQIAAETRVRHESPQLLVFRNGVVVWEASHWRVTAQAVRAVLEGLAAAQAQ